MKILLSAYACRPHEGSEPAVGWNWALQLARRGFDVHVLTRRDNQPSIEREGPIERVRFTYYDLPRPWLWLEKGAGVYLYYPLWQYGAYRHVRREYGENYFDVLHHSTYVSFRFPVFWYRLKGTFIFGPIAGGEESSLNLLATLPLLTRMKERARRLVNRLNAANVFVNTAYRHARHIFVTTAETYGRVPAQYHAKTAIASAIGIDVTEAPPSQKNQEFTILYAGQLLHWKGVHVAIDAVARALRVHPDLKLRIIGDGPFKRRLIRQVQTLGIAANVEFIAHMPQAALFEQYTKAHLFLFPSFHDSGGFVVLEAMCRGLPVICLDRGGPPCIVGRDSRNVITTANKRVGQIADEIARLICEYAQRPSMLHEESLRARARAREFAWPLVVEKVYAAAGLRPSAATP
jgi:glycosyltransferase involved in cell wall biosynthesis